MGSLSAVLEETTRGSQCTTRDPLYHTPRVKLNLSRLSSVALTDISSSGYRCHNSCWKLSRSLTTTNNNTVVILLSYVYSKRECSSSVSLGF